MMVASIEATLEPWASSLRDVKQRTRGLFTQERVAASAGRFLDGLPGDGRRKTGWMRAEAAGDPGPWRQQAILGRGRRDADALRDIVREYTLETPSDADAVLVIDGTGFLEQGRASCGVARQHAGSAGKVANCRIGVLAACVSRHGHAFIDRAFIDRALHLPKVWTDDRARMAAVHVAQETRLATKPAIALAMIERTLGADMAFSRVAADGACGVGAIETVLRRAGKGHVPGVNARHLLHSWARPQAVGGPARDIAGGLDETAWQRLSAGDGTKGERLHEWACLDLADLDIDECDTAPTGLWTRGLPIRRNIADGDLAFFSTWCPAGTAIDTLVGVEGRRRAIEDSFETAGNGPGLDHDETRSRHGRHRHVPLVMPAFAMMATIRHHANAAPPPGTMRRTRRRASPLIQPLIRWSVQEIRRIATRLARRQIHPAHVIAWPLWRRAHNATVVLGSVDNHRAATSIAQRYRLAA